MPIAAYEAHKGKMPWPPSQIIDIDIGHKRKQKLLLYIPSLHMQIVSHFPFSCPTCTMRSSSNILSSHSPARSQNLTYLLMNKNTSGISQVIYKALSTALRNGSVLSDSFFDDNMTASAVIGSTLEVCISYGISAHPWRVSLASHPLPLKNGDMNASDIRFLSDLILQVEDKFFTVDFLQGNQYVGPVMMASLDEFIKRKKDSFFQSHEGQVHTSVEEEAKKPYSSPKAVVEIKEALKSPWSEHRRKILGRVASMPSIPRKIPTSRPNF